MEIILIIVGAWVVLSFPISLVVGRFLASSSNGKPVPQHRLQQAREEAEAVDTYAFG